MEKNVNGQDAEDRVLKVGIFVHENGDHTDVGKEATSSPNNVFFRKPQLTGCVKASIIDRVVVTFRQEFHGSVRP
jgi:hypothetical protein